MEVDASNCTQEVIAFEDNDEDEWYYDSIGRFHQLQMFDFDSPLTHVDFSEIDHICVAGKIRGDRQEIQEFSLPEKSTTSAFESSDLKMKTGGFTTKPLFQMKCLRNQRKLVVSEHTLDGVSVYELGSEKSDYIRKVSEFSSDIQNPLMAVFEKKVVFGSSSSNIHVANIDSNRVDPIFPPDGSKISETKISDLNTWSDFSVGYCECQTGKVTLLDCRSLKSKSFSQFPVKSPGESSKRYSLSVQERGNLVGVLSSCGHVTIFDTRGDSELPVSEVEVCVDSSMQHGGSPLILFSPHRDDMFSVSSVSGGISVYRLEGSATKLVFSYDGHSRDCSRTNVFITNHIWSPTHENLLYSSANDGSFHCWKFIENKL
ncbi:WD repeat-containing protein 73-like [Hetaerina americana]|uniref:WD repeat-containing protein 73-like n=1 Tax=Hetaerina americana TaxID=62018 RepID=UPI003A7F0F61